MTSPHGLVSSCSRPGSDDEEPLIEALHSPPRKRMGVLPNVLCVVTAAATFAAYLVLLRWIGTVSEYTEFTAAQLGVAVFYGLAISAWAGVEAGMLLLRQKPAYSAVVPSDGLKAAPAYESSGENDEEAMIGRGATGPPEASVCGVRASHLPALRALAEFSLIMGYVYICDRTSLIGKGPKTVSKTMFWGLNGAILLLALCTIRSAGAAGEAVTAPLQRDQTEEWKGMMQLMFILYHYFAEVEIYNAIRLYIAAYVWMTGFGNFSYYYIRADFTLPRFMQMMWRLNFFVFFVCVTMNNEYMLYYIAAMHTFFTWGVFFCCWVGNQHNKNSAVTLLKIGVATAATVLLYDVPGVFHTVFAPTKALLGFHDPLHPEFTDSLHEWFFRSGLDHLVWIVGMLCAFAFPWFDRQLQRIQEMETAKRSGATAALVVAALAVFGWYYLNFFSLPKREYNKVHPFTSWIPLLCYIVLRNATATLRAKYMHLFTWCGKVSRF